MTLLFSERDVDLRPESVPSDEESGSNEGEAVAIVDTEAAVSGGGGDPSIDLLNDVEDLSVGLGVADAGEHVDPSGDGLPGLPDPPSAPPPLPRVVARRPDGKAAPGENRMTIGDRTFIVLTRQREFSGYSLACRSCNVCKDLNFAKSTLTEQEAVRRLLAWERACTGSSSSHKQLGGRLLSDFA